MNRPILNSIMYTRRWANPAPTVSSVSPGTGNAAGGTSITVTGTGFLSGATVSVGGVSCTSVNVASSTSITCVTGAHAAGVTDVIVTNTDGQTGTGSGLFTYSAYSNTKSFNFNNTNGLRIDIGQPADINFDIADGFSYSFWIKPTTFPADRVIYDHLQQSGVFPGIRIWHTNAGVIKLYVFDSNSNSLTFTGSISMTTGSWQHIVITHAAAGTTSASWKMYRNGVSGTFSGAGTHTGSIKATQANWFGVSQFGSFTDPLNSYLDEFSFWNTELTAGNVTTLYNSGVASDLSAVSFTSNLLHWYRFGDSSDSYPTFYDANGSYNGTATGGSSSNIVTDAP